MFVLEPSSPLDLRFWITWREARECIHPIFQFYCKLSTKKQWNFASMHA
jgi:hypothetical protein